MSDGIEQQCRGKTFCLVNDLHTGDGTAKDNFAECRQRFERFLDELAEHDNDARLVLAGDVFEFWRSPHGGHRQEVAWASEEDGRTWPCASLIIVIVGPRWWALQTLLQGRSTGIRSGGRKMLDPKAIRSAFLAHTGQYLRIRPEPTPNRSASKSTVLPSGKAERKQALRTSSPANAYMGGTSKGHAVSVPRASTLSPVAVNAPNSTTLRNRAKIS